MAGENIKLPTSRQLNLQFVKGMEVLTNVMHYILTSSLMVLSGRVPKVIECHFLSNR